ncbi:DNA-3-methyladenine glycosylase [Paenibacillus sp. P96]|uniref:DNA-3-methyladenine glycosylase II n=1 Tax=Paenibacillus zeirhizosphaerae TaxID=2987519 RepID=A0ABT9FVK7_9BACL|nr:DNA-3-methyladenine glycosylase [Paenibacillus sp. P96]MDP4098759.1 DNA-3-methyladenine glycosylase [Paenibacillus sp. P96]
MNSPRWTDHPDGVTLTVPVEFSFQENLKYLARSTNECMLQIRNGKVYKAIPAGQDIVMVEVGPDESNQLHVRFLGKTESLDKPSRTEIAHHIHDWFDLGRDLAPFYEMAKSDALLSKAAESFYGLRIIGIPDLFEAVCWGIIGQQINLAFAYTLKRRFVEAYGSSVSCEGEPYWIFPAPHRIAALTVDELKALSFSAKKSEYLIEVARRIADDQLNKELLLETGDIKQAEQMLTSIRGIGPWTANYVLMRCLRFPSAFPIDDVGLHNAIKALLGSERKPTKRELQHLSAHWAPWEAYATFYLWRVLY